MILPGKAKGGGRLSGVLNHGFHGLKAGLHGADETDKKSEPHCMGLNPCNPVLNPCNPWCRQPGERGCRLAFIAVVGVGGMKLGFGFVNLCNPWLTVFFQAFKIAGNLNNSLFR
jgi:hypothetical protein